MRLEIRAMTRKEAAGRSNQDALLLGSTVRSKDFHQAFSVVVPNSGMLFAVADGVSGAPCPATASRRVLKILSELHQLSGAFGTCILRAVQQRLAEEVAGKRCFGMATCIAALHLAPERATLLHAGDCRIYVQRDGQLKQLTEDHTVIAGMIRRGEAPPNERTSYASIYSGVESAIVADPAEAEFEIGWTTVVPRGGDCWVLCSDGVHDVFTNSALDPTTLNDLLALRDLEGRIHAMSLINAIARDFSADDFSLILVYVD